MAEDPYETPGAALQPDTAAPGGYHEPTACRAGQAVQWFSSGWRLFATNPLMLVVISVLLLVIFGVVSLVPLLGWLLAALFWPHLIARLYLALEHAAAGRPVEFADLFRPFGTPGPLLGIGAFYLVAQILLFLVMMVFSMGGIGMSGMLSAISHPEVAGSQMQMGVQGALWMLLGLLIVLALSIPLAMAVIFAPILTYRHAVPALEAFKLSFQGCWRNILPFFIWSLIWLLVYVALALVFFIPVLGWLVGIVALFVMMPLGFANLYRAWEDIFVC